MSIKGEELNVQVGQKVVLFCECYIYSGTVKTIANGSVVLEDAGIVYETGPLEMKSFRDFQKFGNDWSVRIDKIESYGILS